MVSWGKRMVSLVKSHANTTFRRWHLWEIDLIFASELPPGWRNLEFETLAAPQGEPPKAGQDESFDLYGDLGDDRPPVEEGGGR